MNEPYLHLRIYLMYYLEIFFIHILWNKLLGIFLVWFELLHILEREKKGTRRKQLSVNHQAFDGRACGTHHTVRQSLVYETWWVYSQKSRIRDTARLPLVEHNRLSRLTLELPGSNLRRKINAKDFHSH